MKFAVLFSLVVIIFQSSFVSAEIFKRVTSYRINNDKEVKQVFMTRYVRSNWLNGLMICQENSMDLARIGNLEEYSKIQKALKIHSTEFKDMIFIDGKPKDNGGTHSNEWEFVTNNGPVNETIVNLLSQNDYSRRNRYYSHRDRLAMTKVDVFGVKISSTDHSKNFDFLCQKVVKASEFDADIDDDDAIKPIVVDVQTRMFKKLGRFQRKHSDHDTEYFMSNFPLSLIMASQFCKHFNMKLVGIHSEEELKHLGNLLLKQGTTATFSVGHVAERVLENFVIYDQRDHCFGLIFSEYKPEITNFPCDETEKEFICEALKGEHKSSDHKNQDVRTTGMKFLAKYESGDTKKSFFLNEKVLASTWFEAFLYCKSLGMNMYNPDDSKVNEFIIDALHNETLGSWDDGRMYSIGAARFGTESFFYSLTSGHEIKDIGLYDEDKMCLGIRLYTSKLKIEPTYCKSNANLECLCEINNVI